MACHDMAETESENLNLESDVFDQFKKKFKVSLPSYLENLLRFTGFDNVLSLSALDETDIEEINKIARTQICELFPDNSENYLGHFKSAPTKFCILPGQKKILLKIKEFCNVQCIAPVSEKRFSEQGTQTIWKNLKHVDTSVNKSSSESSSFTRTSLQLDCEEAERVEVEVEVNRDDNMLEKTIRWTQEFLQKILDKSVKEDTTQAEVIKIMLPKVRNTTVKELPGTNSTLLVRCFICSSETKIFRAATGTWLLSNYQRHFRTHVAEITRNKRKRSAQRSIISFLQAERANSSTNNETSSLESKIRIIDNIALPNVLPEVSLPQGDSQLEIEIIQNDEPMDTYQIPQFQVVEISADETNKIIEMDDALISSLWDDGSNRELNIENKTNVCCSAVSNKINNSPDGRSTQVTLGLKEDSPNMEWRQGESEILLLDGVLSGESNNNTNDTGLPADDTSDDIHEINESNPKENSQESSQLFNINSSQVTSNNSSKWRHPKYSRHQRNIRKLKSGSMENYIITDFFPYINRVKEEFSKYISSSSPQVKKTLNAFSSSSSIDFSNDDDLSDFFKALVKNTKPCEYKGRKYEKHFKDFCTWLYLTGGKLMYETLHLNMKNIMPSPSTIRKRVVDNQSIEEGKFRFSELKAYLTEHNYPLHVWLCEDQTSINNRIQYSPKNNQLVGFTPSLDENGCPVLNNFPFDSLRQIEQYFEKESKSNYINMIICQPLVNKSSGFCLCVYGTNNRFTAEDVDKRWKHISLIAKEHGITIEGFSTDGDCRMLKVMKNRIGLPTDTNSEWFFARDDEGNPLFVQDTVHIGTKLKTVFLKPSVTLRIGKYEISSEHLRQLINTVSKDKHLLTESDLNPTDKMNFDSFDKMTQEKVIDALLNIPGSEGTRAFLKMSRFILDAFLCKELTPTERLFKIWAATIFFRIWRYIISNDKNATLIRNFITLNCYTCIEINAHALVQYIRRCRESTINQFYPWLLSSQPCEKKFRELRSLTSTFSTVVNFSLLEVLHRLTRVELIGKISQDTGRILFLSIL